MDKIKYAYDENYHIEKMLQEGVKKGNFLRVTFENIEKVKEFNIRLKENGVSSSCFGRCLYVKKSDEKVFNESLDTFILESRKRDEITEKQPFFMRRKSR